MISYESSIPGADGLDVSHCSSAAALPAFSTMLPVAGATVDSEGVPLGMMVLSSISVRPALETVGSDVGYAGG